MTGEKPSFEKQTELFSALQNQYCEELRAEGLRVAALYLTSAEERSRMNATTQTKAHLGDVFDIQDESVQSLSLCFDTTFLTSANEARKLRSLVPVVNLYPATDEWEALEGLNDTQARLLMAIMRGLLRAQIEDIPDMSANLDSVTPKETATA